MGADDTTGNNSDNSDSAETRLSPAARLLWRGSRTVQLELGADKLVVDGVSTADVRALLQPRSTSAQPDAPGEVAELASLRKNLGRRGFLWTASEAVTPPHPYLSHELTALAARRGRAAGRVLAERGQQSVVVQGKGRAGPLIAALLAAAGVGRVHVLDRCPTHLAQTIPGGAGVDDEGGPLSDAASAAIARVAPRADTSAPAFGERPELVVLAIDQPIDSDIRAGLHARECAHLVARLAPGGGAVGPLVLPGLTSCLACADLHRRDRDPAWPALAVQLTVPPRQPVTSDVCTSATLAAVAAAQALSYLDGEQPPTLEGTLELHPPDWRVRRRSWPAHPDCECVRAHPAPGQFPGPAR